MQETGNDGKFFVVSVWCVCGVGGGVVRSLPCCFAAGTGLDTVYDSLIDKIGAGSKGSKIAAALSFIGGLWQARQGNLGIAATSFGIATLLGIGVENII
jgi:hypothetical protein